jgi:hypothetical protein
MIISHKYKFIFIKTQKTAGTSIEIGLSKFLGNEDVITRISPADERTRKELGYPGPQRYTVPFRNYTRKDWARLFLRSYRLAFFNHASAKWIKAYVGDDIWSSYFKFCFERNPWDKAVSYYYWETTNGLPPTISEFIQSGRANKVQGFDLYTLDGEIAVDRVCRFERLGEEIKAIASIVGLPEVPVLPRAKGGKRRDKRHYREVLSEADRMKIARVFAREIAHFGYEW